MTVKDIVNRLTSGAAHLYLISDDTGEIYLKTIWYNQIPEEFLDREVIHITVRDYEIQLFIL